MYTFNFGINGENLKYAPELSLQSKIISVN